MKTAILLAALIASALTLPASAQSMQDQTACAKLAEQEIVNARPNWQGGSLWPQSHYNTKLHTCMALITGTQNSPYPQVVKWLIDPIGGHGFAGYNWANQDGKKYWEVKPYACTFEKVPYGPETYCNSSEEFEAGIQPYMTD